MKITVYGDSILKGVRYENGEFVVVPFWESRLSEQLGAEICNRSHFGFTIRNALGSIRRRSGKANREPELTILEMGGNDCDYDWKSVSERPNDRHLCHTPPEEFVAAYRESISLLRAGGSSPVMLTLPPIHSRRYLDYICRDGLSRENILSWLGCVDMISSWQQTYSDLIRQLAREEQVPLIDVRTALLRSGSTLEDLLSADGIHPSAKGQEQIYDCMKTHASEWFKAS